MPTMFAAAGVDDLIKTGGSCRVNADVKAHFVPGDKIVARNINPVSTLDCRNMCVASMAP